MNSLVSKITDSELEVIRVLWSSKGALSITSIRQALEASSSWESSTIKTLLRRLCEKGAVQAEKKDVFYYSARITEKEYNEYATQTLIDRLYKGSAINLAASLVSGNKLNKNDIEELRAMFKVGGKDE